MRSAGGWAVFIKSHGACLAAVELHAPHASCLSSQDGVGKAPLHPLGAACAEHLPACSSANGQTPGHDCCACLSQAQSLSKPDACIQEDTSRMLALALVIHVCRLSLSVRCDASGRRMHHAVCIEQSRLARVVWVSILFRELFGRVGRL